jgi:hypothetical protein
MFTNRLRSTVNEIDKKGMDFSEPHAWLSGLPNLFWRSIQRVLGRIHGVQLGF